MSNPTDRVLDILHDQPRGTIKLVGQDGNAMSILARATQSARRAGWDKRAIDLLKAELFSSTYDEFLGLVMDLFDFDTEDEDW